MTYHTASGRRSAEGMRSSTPTAPVGCTWLGPRPTGRRMEWCSNWALRPWRPPLAIRPEQAVIDPRASVFRLSAGQISRRIKAATKAAGLAAGFSAHSPRVRVTQDPSTAGQSCRSSWLLEDGRSLRCRPGTPRPPDGGSCGRGDFIGSPDVETAVRTTGLLTAGRNPGDRTGPACRTVARPAPLPHQGREVFGDVYRCSRQPGDADIAGPGHELTLLPRVGLSGRIRPAGRDGTGDGRGETAPTLRSDRRGEGLRCRLRAEGPRSSRESCPGANGCRLGIHLAGLLPQ